MNNNLTILKFFVEHKDEGFTIKKVAETLKMNYRIIYEEIMALEKEQLIKIIKQGNSKVCTFKYTYHSKMVEIEDARKQELHKEIQLIYNRIREIQNPYYTLLLFGSYANKTNKKGSDIDLCFISDNKNMRKELNSITGITPLNIHLQEFTSEEFSSMLKSKEFNVGNEILKNNIILHGMEAFYEMINNVKQ